MNNLRKLREDADLKQIDVAKEIGVSQQQYARYESGISDPDIKCLIHLADFFNVSLDYLTGRTNIKQKPSDKQKEILKKAIDIISLLIED